MGSRLRLWSRLLRGIRAGVSAIFAGKVAGVPVIAGGANFPDTPVWEGGKKAFYSDMYAFEEGEWRYVGALAEPLAYGMTAPVGSDRILLIGGARLQRFCRPGNGCSP